MSIIKFVSKQSELYFRNFASLIQRPFGVRYNPYTQSVDVLDNTKNIAYVVSEVKGDLSIVSDALRRVQQLEKSSAAPLEHPTAEQPAVQ